MPEAPAVLLVGSAGPGEGRGHVARVVTIAEALRDAGATVAVDLLRGTLTPAEVGRLEAAGVMTGRGPSPTPAAVVIDVPAPDEVVSGWPADRLVVFDDGDRLTGDAALVIQPSLPAWRGRGAAGRVLAGYAYAPIRRSLRDLASDRASAAATATTGAARREVVVCFGGGDPADVSARLVPPIAGAVREERGGGRVTAIVGRSYAGSLATGNGWTLLRDPADFDARLARATVAVIGGGTMKFEAAHLGVPAVIVAVSDDQPAVAPRFAETGAARYAGDGRTIAPSDVAATVRDLLADPERRAAMSRAGRAAVDGRGAERVADAVLDVVRRTGG